MSTQTPTAASSKSTGRLKTIIWSGLAAIVVFHSRFNLRPGQVMQFIASGVYGPSSFTGGMTTIIAGIFFHFLIAYILAVFYFFAFPQISFLRTQPVISGLNFGFGIWLVMNILVIPMSRIQSLPFDAGLVAVSIVWHMILVGLPVALITKKHFSHQDSKAI
jgi:hypothetical protein